MRKLWNIAKWGLPYLKNLYVLTGLVFITWMLVFDRHNVISQFELHQKLNQLKEDKAYYTKENEQNKQAMHELMTNPENLEKFAREKYLMKKEGEEVFVIIEH